jgi:Tfp pilus assembly protein PilE
MAEEKEIRVEKESERVQRGYTLVELLGVTAIMVFVVLAAQGMTRNYKRYAFEETAVQRLKEIAKVENVFRFSNDPTVNPEGTYGTFFQLQNAGLVPMLYEQSDEKRHTVDAFVPNYRVEFVQTEEDPLRPDKENVAEQLDSFGYLMRATPLTNSLGLRTFFMREDGEVYWRRYAFQYWIR